MDYFGKAFVIYQGHHGDEGAHRADVILPGAAYTEKDGLYVNTEGRVQEGFRAIFPPGEAKDDWQIIADLARQMKKKLPFTTREELRTALVKAHPVFAKRGVTQTAPCTPPVASPEKISSETFDYPITNFYRTDPISRASKTMAECTEMMMKNTRKAA